jgi:hypothetical protein
MCDTLVALPPFTGQDVVLLTKNSDREPNEAQALTAEGDLLMGRPFPMRGAEMGLNARGVAIGNEAVFTRVPFDKPGGGRTGMAFLRAALEEAGHAEQAMAVILRELQRHGPDACGGYENRDFYYHNSYLIADPWEAWVLETAGRTWAARRVRPEGEGLRAISNGLTLGTDWDRVDPGLEAEAARHGIRIVEREGRVNFAGTFADRFYTRASGCRVRRRRHEAFARTREGAFGPAEAMDGLRQRSAAARRAPGWAGTGSVSMHATGFWNPSQTVNSMVFALRPSGHHTAWCTGCSGPHAAVFKPVYPRAAGPGAPMGLPADAATPPGARPDASFWWAAERVHRKLYGLPETHPRWRAFAGQAEALQREILEEDAALRDASPAERLAFTARCWRRDRERLAAWDARLERASRRRWTAPWYGWWWHRQDRIFRS